ncbi:MAG: signal peptide peptidase SppA [Phycisphaerales bacterium]|nr:signal peptide peptidase SppA [Phycisphaerales bacterium]
MPRGQRRRMSSISTPRMQQTLAFAWAVLAGVLCLGQGVGCQGSRLIFDFAPDDRLEETVVLADQPAGFMRQRRKVALIDVSGLIADASVPAVLGGDENPVSLLAESLRHAASDHDVRAVVVRVNSPGGGVTASDVMYRELMHFKERTKKPVVVLMGDVAASGGFYLACAGDEVIAHPTTITGSIGVIVQTMNFSEGLRRIGIHANAITSGPNKTMGSPLQPMSPEHRALLQGIVDELYAGFITIVETRRPDLDDETLATVTDGRVVTGAHAAELGLVDRTGDLRDAFAAAKTRAGLERARLIKYHRPMDYVGSAYATSAAVSPRALLEVNLPPTLTTQPAFMYLWEPTAW